MLGVMIRWLMPTITKQRIDKRNCSAGKSSLLNRVRTEPGVRKLYICELISFAVLCVQGRPLARRMLENICGVKVKRFAR